MFPKQKYAFAMPSSCSYQMSSIFTSGHSTRWLRYYNHTLIQSQATTAVELDVEMLIQGIIYQMRNLKQTHPRICRSAFLYVYNYLLEAGGQLDDQASTSSASD
uniref:Uncharacterized protein n=1 Tax=Trichobilharzia regenti TaxID=157069 RepID=A0AA85J094_TRIRE|nr:unnamed protein product [Trichobilharzia regenti]